MDNKTDCKSNSSNKISGNYFCFWLSEEKCDSQHQKVNNQTSLIQLNNKLTLRVQLFAKGKQQQKRLTLMVVTVYCCLFSVKEDSVSL